MIAYLKSVSTKSKSRPLRQFTLIIIFFLQMDHTNTVSLHYTFFWRKLTFKIIH